MLTNEVVLYLEGLIPRRDNQLEEMEKYAIKNNIPIMELVGIEAMLLLLRIHNPKRILEVGTAIGYSAIRMAKALPQTKIISIERDEERYEMAKKNIEETGTSPQIEIVFGDALEVIDRIKEMDPFDCIFIDAAKGQYRRFFEGYEHCLSKDGIIITDNVLFKGLVATQEVENKRTNSLVNKIKSYNEWLVENQDYFTAIIPVGDGIAVSKRRGE